jgi:hypothetical protein
MDHSQSCMADPEKTARSLIVASKLVASGRLPQAAVGLVLQLVSIVEQCTENYNPRMSEEAENSLENDVDKYLCVPVSYSLTAEKVDEWLSDDVKQGDLSIVEQEAENSLENGHWTDVEDPDLVLHLDYNPRMWEEAQNSLENDPDSSYADQLNYLEPSSSHDTLGTTTQEEPVKQEVAESKHYEEPLLTGNLERDESDECVDGSLVRKEKPDPSLTFDVDKTKNRLCKERVTDEQHSCVTQRLENGLGKLTSQRPCAKREGVHKYIIVQRARAHLRSLGVMHAERVWKVRNPDKNVPKVNELFLGLINEHPDWPKRGTKRLTTTKAVTEVLSAMGICAKKAAPHLMHKYRGPKEQDPGKKDTLYYNEMECRKETAQKECNAHNLFEGIKWEGKPRNTGSRKRRADGSSGGEKKRARVRRGERSGERA